MISRTTSMTISSPLRRALAAAALGLGLIGAAGCNAATSPEGASAPEEPVAAQAAAAQPGDRPDAPPFGGPAAIFLHEVDELSLRADQRQAVDAIRARLREQGAGMREAHAKLDAELVRAVRDGKIDRGKLQPLTDAVDQAAARMRPAMEQALDDLHGALDASQRKELLDAVQEKAERGPGPRGPRGGPHGMHDGPPHGMHDGPPHGMRGGPLAMLARDLDLTEEQEAAIRAQMDRLKAEHEAEMAARKGDPHERRARMRERMEAFAAAFEGDDFSAKDFAPPADGPMGKPSAGRMIGLLEALMPVLSAEQRARLADHIEHRPRPGEE